MYCVRVIVDKDWNFGDGFVQLWLNDDFVSDKDFHANFQFAQTGEIGGVGKIGVQTRVNRGGLRDAPRGHLHRYQRGPVGRTGHIATPTGSSRSSRRPDAPSRATLRYHTDHNDPRSPQ